MRIVSKLRRSMYRSGSVLGDFQAVASGEPSKMAKRVIRKKAWSVNAGLLRKVLRRFGL